MVKITPDPPFPCHFSTDDDEPDSDFQRSDRLFLARQSISTEEALTAAYEILDCAAVTAYESTEGLDSFQRKRVLTVVHLLDTAQALVEAALVNQQPRADSRSQ